VFCSDVEATAAPWTQSRECGGSQGSEQSWRPEGETNGNVLEKRAPHEAALCGTLRAPTHRQGVGKADVAREETGKCTERAAGEQAQASKDPQHEGKPKEAGGIWSGA
jgi:hypothetical protein